MKTFVLAIGTIAFIIFALLLLLLIKINIGDIIYSILGGVFVSIFASMVAMIKNIPSWRILLMVLYSIIASVMAWIIAMILLRITTISLYNITALAFDLIVGIIGAIAVSSMMLEEYSNKKEAG